MEKKYIIRQQKVKKKEIDKSQKTGLKLKFPLMPRNVGHISKFLKCSAGCTIFNYCNLIKVTSLVLRCQDTYKVYLHILWIASRLPRKLPTK